MLDAVLISFLVYLYVGISTKVLPREITMELKALDILMGITICFSRQEGQGEPSLTRTAFWSETSRTRFPFCKVEDQVYSRKYLRSTLFYVWRHIPRVAWLHLSIRCPFSCGQNWVENSKLRRNSPTDTKSIAQQQKILRYRYWL